MQTAGKLKYVNADHLWKQRKRFEFKKFKFQLFTPLILKDKPIELCLVSCYTRIKFQLYAKLKYFNADCLWKQKKNFDFQIFKWALHL